MLVQSFLVQGTGAAVSSGLARLSSSLQLDAVVMFSLGANHPILLDAVRENDVSCPVYLTETYGILGYDSDSKRNVELMEKGRGSEYGFVGGSGGQGCLVAGFSEGAVAGHTDDFPADANSVLIVADQSKEWSKVESKAPLQYGGITKECWRVTDSGDLESVPYFWIADTSREPIGVSTFTEDATEAISSLLKEMPSERKSSGSVGLFPCFTRGVNQYGKENVESEGIGSVLGDARIYGMFAHGELGPSEFAGFTAEANKIPCKQHSMTSIIAIHTDAASLN
jgi:hypothetical protein